MKYQVKLLATGEWKDASKDDADASKECGFEVRYIPESQQDVFDIGYNGIIEQGCLGTEEGSTSCRYRATHSDGKVVKCVAGMLMFDDEISTYYNSKSIQLVMDSGAVPRLSEYRSLLIAMQDAHDDAGCDFEYTDNNLTRIKTFKERMTFVANKFNLKVPS